LAVRIRQFRKYDTTEVLGLANRYTAFDGTTSEEGLATDFPGGFWVAEENGRLVGFVHGQLRDVPAQVLERWKATKVGHITLMAVAPSHRRKGIGRGLLAKLLEEFKAAGADMVLLDCPAEAVDARKLYEKMGFEPRFYGMRKRL
jgi:ribosomal protein S18 acetylase RimI-like enzyme